MPRWLFLPQLRSLEDLTLLLLRLGTGGFLIYGVWDNVSDPARMAEFVGFLSQFKFPAPSLLAPLSVWAQLLCGGLIIAGLFTRWAGLIMAFNFAVAIVMVDRFAPAGLRGVWPAGALLLISLHLATHGAGRFGLDTFAERARPRRRRR
jgi:putative oxidoreductase